MIPSGDDTAALPLSTSATSFPGPAFLPSFQGAGSSALLTFKRELPGENTSYGCSRLPARDWERRRVMPAAAVAAGLALNGAVRGRAVSAATEPARSDEGVGASFGEEV